MCLALRRLQFFSKPQYYQTLMRDGVVAIPDYAPGGSFDALKAEILHRFDEAEKAYPIDAAPKSRGFGSKQPFPGGFDRFDGGTLNRFLDMSPSSTPNSFEFAQHVSRTSPHPKGAGSLLHAGKFSLYQVVHGDEENNADLQKVLHRDTFHSALKVWYFVEDVTLAHGPLEYVIGSHKMDERRMSWEYIKSLRASSKSSKYGKGGAFRFSDADIKFLGLGAPTPLPVKANTLVVADVRGIHRRGMAAKGTRRVGLYANIRPHPFLPFRN